MSAFWEWGYPDLPACGPGHRPLHQPSTTMHCPTRGKALVRPLGSRGGAASRPAEDGPPQAPSGAVGISIQGRASRVKDDAGKDRRAPARQTEQFPLWCKGGKDVRGFPKHPPKVSIPVQQDHDHEPHRTDVIAEPTSASSTATLQAKTAFGQGGDVLLSPFKFGHCGIPSRHCDKGRGPGPL